MILKSSLFILTDLINLIFIKYFQYRSFTQEVGKIP